MDVHRPVGGVVDYVNVFACIFFSLQDTFKLPVSPVKVILKDCDGKDVVDMFGRCIWKLYHHVRGQPPVEWINRVLEYVKETREREETERFRTCKKGV